MASLFVGWVAPQSIARWKTHDWHCVQRFYPGIVWCFLLLPSCLFVIPPCFLVLLVVQDSSVTCHIHKIVSCPHWSISTLVTCGGLDPTNEPLYVPLYSHCIPMTVDNCLWKWYIMGNNWDRMGYIWHGSFPILSMNIWPCAVLWKMVADWPRQTPYSAKIAGPPRHLAVPGQDGNPTWLAVGVPIFWGVGLPKLRGVA